ncbi:MAG: hypothetical protein K1X68_03810 [Saprospiraceae bacterium]|nr:hypothetical protein [Saprospiraceae bacterium]MBX7175875.1 hypothetical protein [Saprospiraceae bacterium]HMW40464.1 hypothetical protein [Saprospiraceae bacterium]HMX88862.1 hypothetical protein [Saprospiraceae bacterium]HMZ41009.1 hypothetical protein [Saprospiraceae bacterium]
MSVFIFTHQFVFIIISALDYRVMAFADGVLSPLRCTSIFNCRIIALGAKLDGQGAEGICVPNRIYLPGIHLLSLRYRVGQISSFYSWDGRSALFVRCPWNSLCWMSHLSSQNLSTL